jgi:hypothetical protein
VGLCLRASPLGRGLRGGLSFPQEMRVIYSTWVREALETRLAAERGAEREQRHRKGYERHPVLPDESNTDSACVAWTDCDQTPSCSRVWCGAVVRV